MRFYGTSSQLLLYDTKEEAGNRIREPNQEPKTTTRGRAEMSGGNYFGR